MARALLPEDLWSMIKPVLPPDKPPRSNGRPAVPNRRALVGILFVLRTGIPWSYLPKEMGCGSGVTCWHRLRDWQESGVCDKVFEAMLAHLHQSDGIDWSHAIVDSASVRALFGGSKRAQTPQTGAKSGSKHHILTDAQGIPLAITLTGANAHGITQLLPLVQAIPPVRGKRGRPRRRPKLVQGDRGYDSQPHRDALRALGIESLLAKGNTKNGSGLGRTRWVVERTLAWLHQHRRLRVRYERRPDIHKAFLTTGCIIICYNIPQRF